MTKLIEDEFRVYLCVNPNGENLDGLVLREVAEGTENRKFKWKDNLDVVSFMLAKKFSSVFRKQMKLVVGDKVRVKIEMEKLDG